MPSCQNVTKTFSYTLSCEILAHSLVFSLISHSLTHSKSFIYCRLCATGIVKTELPEIPATNGISACSPSSIHAQACWQAQFTKKCEGVRWDGRSQGPRDRSSSPHLFNHNNRNMGASGNTYLQRARTHTHIHTHTQACPSRRSKSKHNVGLKYRERGVLTEPTWKSESAFCRILLRGGWIPSPGCILVCEEERL